MSEGIKAPNSGSLETTAPDTPAPDTPAPNAGGPVTEQATLRWLYADKPLRRHDPDARDALALGPYADALALLMDWQLTDTPLTIAVNGPWGSGKTTLADMTRYRLKLRFGRDWGADHVICRFDAWQHDDAPNLGAAFAATVAKTVNAERHLWRRLWSPLPSAMLSPVERRRRWLWLGLVTLFVAAVAVFWPSSGSLLTAILHPATKLDSLGHGAGAARLAIPAVILALIACVQQLWPGIQSVANWIDSPGSQAALGSMSDVNKQLGRLIEQALRGKRRLIIFVDNLERCRPPRSVEVCEVVTQLIGHKDVVTVLIGDMDTVAMSAEVKYAALESVAKNAKPGDFGRAYLDKLIQIQLRLPPPQDESLRHMFIPRDDPPAFPVVKPAPGFLARQRAKLTDRFDRWRQTALLIGGLTLAVPVFLVDAVAGVGVAFAVFAGLSAGGPLLETLNIRRTNRTNSAIQTRLEDELPESGEPLPETEKQKRAEEVAKEVSAHTGQVDPREVRRRMLQLNIDTSLRAELDQALLKVLPNTPRAAKRMVNHAHLLLAIGVERRIVGAGVRPCQLAAWVSFTDRWPDVAATVAASPDLMQVLEDHARRLLAANMHAVKLPKSLITAGIPSLAPDLVKFLQQINQSSPASPLGPVAAMLVRFARPYAVEVNPATLPQPTEWPPQPAQPFQRLQPQRPAPTRPPAPRRARPRASASG